MPIPKVVVFNIRIHFLFCKLWGLPGLIPFKNIRNFDKWVLDSNPLIYFLQPCCEFPAINPASGV